MSNHVHLIVIPIRSDSLFLPPSIRTGPTPPISTPGMEDFVAGLERTLQRRLAADKGGRPANSRPSNSASAESAETFSGTQWSNLLPVHIQRENRRQRPPALQESIAASADSTAWLPRPNGAIFYQYIFEERTGGKDRRRYKSR